MKKFCLVLMLSLSVFVLGCKNNDNATGEENLDESFEEIVKDSNDFTNQSNVDGIEDISDVVLFAQKQYQAGNFEEAIKLYNKAIEMDNNNNGGFFAERGRCKRELGDLDGAIEDINEALKLSQDGWIYGERGVTYRKIGNKKAALEDYKKALSIDPNMDWVKKDIEELM